MAKMKESASVSGKGIYSYKKNPLRPAKQVPIGVGPGSNKDQSKVNKLVHQAYMEKDSMRGEMGM